MLITKQVTTKWNSKTKSYYENLGYVYTGMKTDLLIDVNHLMDSSVVNVAVKCDYCGCEFQRRWNYYIKTHELIEKDSCTKCYGEKAKEGNILKYGKSNPMQIEEFKEKQKNTIIKKYGVENVFQLDEIKTKIKNGFLLKYGVTSYTKTEEYLEKSRETSLNRYGETNHMKTKESRVRFSGENSPVWKGGFRDERWDRLQSRYKEWRMSVFKRDNFVCQKCLIHPEYLEAHHIYNWKDNEEVRYDINNGISLCQLCHIEFHRIYGKKNNNLEQLTDFLKI